MRLIDADAEIKKIEEEIQHTEKIIEQWRSRKIPRKNMRQAMQDMYGPKEYCEACKDKIEKCIKQCVNHGKENYEP